MATLTVYPDPSSGATTVDGAVARTGVTDADWATIRAGAGKFTRVVGFGTGQEYAFYWVGNAGGETWNTLQRFIATFDLSSIAGATVSAVTLSIYPNAKLDPASVAPDLNVYGATPAADNALANADYGQTGATAYCDTPITYANFNVASPAYQDFVFNATGIAAVQTAVDAATKVFRLSLKNANKDVANVAPTNTTNETSMTIESADKGTTYRPRLVITYTAEASVWTASMSAISVVLSIPARVIKYMAWIGQTKNNMANTSNQTKNSITPVNQSKNSMANVKNNEQR